MADEEEDFEKSKAQIEEILKKLTARQAKVLRDRLMNRFGTEFPSSADLEEIGNQYEVTRERVREIEAKALRKLSKHKGGDDDDDPVPA